MFEYRFIDSRTMDGFKKFSTQDIESKLNEFGMAGWEIIDVEFQGLNLDERYFIALAKRKK